MSTSTVPTISNAWPTSIFGRDLTSGTTSIWSTYKQIRIAPAPFLRVFDDRIDPPPGRRVNGEPMPVFLARIRAATRARREARRYPLPTPGVAPIGSDRDSTEAADSNSSHSDDTEVILTPATMNASTELPSQLRNVEPAKYTIPTIIITNEDSDDESDATYHLPSDLLAALDADEPVAKPVSPRKKPVDEEPRRRSRFADLFKKLEAKRQQQ